MTQTEAGTPAGTPPFVVVGVDGSAASERALLFAAREAQLRQAALHVVGAHDLGTTVYSSSGGFGGGWELGPVEDALRQATETLVAGAADTVRALPGPDVEVRTLVLQGRPSYVLLDAAEGAELLVVGARGAGLLTRMMMGSTSTEVVHGAGLPVVVVPGEAAPATGAVPE